MRKLSLGAIILIFCVISASSQSCLPDGILFYTQEQIDSFQFNYPNCTEIEGGVTIHGHESNIENLNGLNVLNSIGGNLSIYETSINNLTGLDNIVFIGGALTIGDSDVPYSSEGNPLLESLTGLENLTSIGGRLKIRDNDALTSLTGLENLTSIGGNLDIAYVPLSSLSGLDNVTSIGGSIEIYRTALTSLSGLENLTSIQGNLTIGKWLTGVIPYGGNPNLTSLSGLDNVTSIGGGFYIELNGDLTNFSGLDNLTSIWGNLRITSNYYLASLSGLENLTTIGGNLFIENNTSLSHCSVISVCNYLNSPNGTINIGYNTAGCNSPEEVQDSCESNAGIIDDIYINSKLELYPNPAMQEVNISTDDGREVDEVSIYTLTGQQVLKARLVYGIVDISHLQPGMYIVEVMVEGRRIRQKLLVE